MRLKIEKGKDIKKSTFIIFSALLLVLITANLLYFGNKYLGFLFEGGANTTSETATTEVAASDYECTVSDDGAILTKYNGKATDLSIPSKFQGKLLIGIADGAFVNNKNLKSVVIPDTVTDIGAGCFENCTQLKKVTLPKSLKAIGYSAFESCALQTVVLPDTVKSVGESAFYNCKSLENITVSDGLTALGAYAFDETLWYENAEDGLLVIGKILYGYKGEFPKGYTLKIPADITVIADASFSGRNTLKSIGFSDDVEYIGVAAFAGCAAITEMKIPMGVVSIADEAFNSCAALRSVSIPSSVTAIGSSILVNCPKLESIEVNEFNKSFTADGKALYNSEKTRLLAFCPASSAAFFKVSDKVSSIDSAVFYGCENLISVTLPEPLTALPEYMFYGCKSLTSLTVPDAVSTISDAAFYGCTALEKVQLPTGLNTLGNQVFYGCTALKTLIIRGSGAYRTEGGVLFSSDMMSLTVYPCALEAASYTIPDTVINIGTAAFLGAAHLRSVVLPEGLTIISDEAFAECALLTSVTVPDAVGELGDYCFANCASLISVNIGKTVNTIGDGVFNGCYALKRFVVGADNTHFSVQNGILYDAKKTTLIGYPAGRAAKEFTVPKTVTTIKSAAFYGCTYLERIFIAAAVTTLSPESFIDCQTLEAFTVDENNKTYEDHDGILFMGAADIIKYPASKKGSSYTVPDTVVTIRSYAFENCQYLSDVTVGAKTTSLGTDAFFNISGLTLHCPKGSKAQEYAVEYDINYKLTK